MIEKHFKGMHEPELEFLEGLGSEGFKTITLHGAEGKDIAWLNTFQGNNNKVQYHIQGYQ